MKNIKLVFLLVIFYSMTYGQDSKFAVGIELTPLLTQLKGNFKPPIDLNGIDPRDATVTWSSQFGFAAGLSFEYFINKRYSLKSGLAYQRKGAKTIWYLIDDVIDYYPSKNDFKRMNFDYLTLPLTGSFTTKGKIKFYMDAGVYFGYLLSQKDIYTFESQPEKAVYNNIDQVKRLDFGLSLGLGLKIPLSSKLLMDFGLCNNNGLININKSYLRNDAVLRTGSNGLQIGLKYLL